MNKKSILAFSFLLASGSMLSAQFTVLPPNFGGGLVDAGYQTMLTNTGYANPFTMDGSTSATWDAPPVLTPGVDFDPLGSMRIFFVGQNASWVESMLGIRLGGATAQYDPNVIEAGDFSLFDASNPYGYTVTVALGGNTSFDFWLSTQDPDTREGDFGTDRLGLWSMFNPEYNNPNAPQTIQGKGTNINYGGEIFHLFAWEDVYRDHETSDDDFNDFVFAVQFFHEDDTPFTAVPEPSTYGVFAILGLLGIISLRRFKNKSA